MSDFKVPDAESIGNFEADGRQYELRYDIGRVKMFERMTGYPVIKALGSDGMMTLDMLATLMAAGMREAGGGFLNLAEGKDIAELVMTESGYALANASVVAALARDCPFLFKVRS